jgi:hypothetical protein
MPKVGDMLESKFLKQQDVGNGALMTVAGCEQRNVAKQGAEPEHKWCLLFEEEEKPLCLNSTNIQLCKAIFESDDTDHWIGKKVVLYTDPTIMYAGKVVGGIRVRKPKQQANKPKPAPVPAPRAEDVDEDEIPF